MNRLDGKDKNKTALPQSFICKKVGRGDDNQTVITITTISLSAADKELGYDRASRVRPTTRAERRTARPQNRRRCSEHVVGRWVRYVLIS